VSAPPPTSCACASWAPLGDGVLADAVTEWSLPSDPWSFFVDKSGTIVERFDGIATADEIEGGIARIA
jgi:hypothetical protein